MTPLILASSKNFDILSEYEIVLLRNKTNGKQIKIGDFYGDPNVAIISSDESFCAIGGYGVIIYYIKEPFIEYQYDFKTTQWKEWGRSSNKDIWIDEIKIINKRIIEVVDEFGNHHYIQV